ncbi:MAG: DUF4345 domain-containing protein [Pseudomonadota bacterium]|nr:DUF4345 domain-containing protein [Pseudomonadota bacterium]
MKLGLQIGLGILSLIPLVFSVMGVMAGASYFMPDGGYPAALDNQLRYLSAIYVLVTFLLWWAIPNVEKHGTLLAFICAAIFIGGLARLVSHLTVGPGQPEQMAGMALELISPLFLIWQRLVARKAAAA